MTYDTGSYNHIWFNMAKSANYVRVHFKIHTLCPTVCESVTFKVLSHKISDFKDISSEVSIIMTLSVTLIFREWTNKEIKYFIGH